MHLNPNNHYEILQLVHGGIPSSISIFRNCRFIFQVDDGIHFTLRIWDPEMRAYRVDQDVKTKSSGYVDEAVAALQRMGVYAVKVSTKEELEKEIK